MMNEKPKVAYQGVRGAYSHLACRKRYGEEEGKEEEEREEVYIPCSSFKEAIKKVKDGDSKYALLPIENTLGGPVVDVHRELRSSNLYIVGEHFFKVEHHLLAVEGAKLKDIKKVKSHYQALNQCSRTLQALGIEQVRVDDTAGAAKEIYDSEEKDPEIAVIASKEAGDLYKLVSLNDQIPKGRISDGSRNTTRFLVLSRDLDDEKKPESSYRNLITLDSKRHLV